MMRIIQHIRLDQLLKWAFFFLLFGFGLKFLSGKGPFSFLDFQETFLNQCVGVLFLLFSAGSWSRNRGVVQSIACISFAFLMADSLAAFQSSGYVPEQLIEHGAKLFLPLLFVMQEFPSWNERKQQLMLKVIVALTFVGHGLFAVGWHYVPGSFHAMTTSILGVTGNQSTNFLLTVGILDFIAAFCLFLPKRFARIALYYLVVWGLLTTLARISYPISDLNFEFTAIYDGLAGTIYRIPHTLLPLWLFVYVYRNNSVSSPSELIKTT